MNFPALFINPKKAYKIDFSLIPIGIFILEFSVLLTELAKSNYDNPFHLFLLRIVHAIFLVSISTFLAFIYKKLRDNRLKYIEIAIPGVLVILSGIFIHRYFAELLDVEVVGLPRSIGVGLLQAFFWYPALIMIGGKRTEILEDFKLYEQRLISLARTNSRNSIEFQELQGEIQGNIRKELNSNCSKILEAVSKVEINAQKLQETNNLIQPHLLGEKLRLMSMSLDTFGSKQQENSFLGQNTKYMRLLVSQFKMLYSATAKVAPLGSSTYTLVLMILITPAYINYFSFEEAAISYPLIGIVVFAFSKLIVQQTRLHSRNSLRNSSILIYLTGIIPMIFNLVGQAITQEPRTQFPLSLGAVTLPAGYYIFMKFLQVLQPQAIDLIRSDDLQASPALQKEVSRIVGEEFSHTVSHRWAVYIHGKILTRLAATSLKFESASISNNRETFEEAFISLIDLLKAPDKEFDTKTGSLEFEVKSRLDPWLGLLQIQLEIESSLKNLDSPRVSDLGEVIEEVISNSMRHGKAQSLTISISSINRKEIEVSVIDDAEVSPPEVQTRYGLGTRIFNLASDGRWSLTRVGFTTRFSLIMAIKG